MSKEAAKKAGAEEEVVVVPAKGGKKKLIIIVAGLVVVLLVVAIGLVLVLRGKHTPPAEGEAVAEEVEQAETHDAHPPVFLNLDSFTVNLQPEGSETYLQTLITLQLADDKAGEKVRVYMPQLRHQILSALSGKQAAEIVGPEGREVLANEIRDISNSVLGYSAAKEKAKASKEKAPVSGVFFTQFIVQ